jgi:predicted component of type VI protein secretion system
MHEYYTNLAGALRQRLALIADRDLREKNPALQLEKLKFASERIEELKANLPTDADPMLTHYLERMSLGKALELIERAQLR